MQRFNKEQTYGLRSQTVIMDRRVKPGDDSGECDAHCTGDGAEK